MRTNLPPGTPTRPATNRYRCVECSHEFDGPAYCASSDPTTVSMWECPNCVPDPTPVVADIEADAEANIVEVADAARMAPIGDLFTKTVALLDEAARTRAARPVFHHNQRTSGWQTAHMGLGYGVEVGEGVGACGTRLTTFGMALQDWLFDTDTRMCSRCERYVAKRAARRNSWAGVVA